MAHGLLIGTVETKADEMAYLTGALQRHGLNASVRQVFESTAAMVPGLAHARFVAEAAAAAMIDLNVHELGRMHLAGAHVPVPTRFTCAGHLPRVVLPGALNFLGLGALETVPAQLLARPHYSHSGLLTDAKLTADEMADKAAVLAALLNQSTAPGHVLITMGGFSHEDRPGGAIEGPASRAITADVLEAQAPPIPSPAFPPYQHPQTAAAAVSALQAAVT